MAWEPLPPAKVSLTTGSLGALNAELILDLFSASTATIQVTGTWVGTLSFTLSNDGFVNAYAANFSSATIGLTSTTTVNGNFRVYGPSGYAQLRAKMTSYTSGSAAVTLTSSSGNATQVAIVNGLFQEGEVPSFFKPILIGGTDPLTNAANSVNVDSSGRVQVDGSSVTQPVSGTFWPATQPVSGTFWQSTQPVSGPLTDTQLRATPIPVSGTTTDGGAGKTLKRAVVSLAATGDVVALVAGKKLKVYQYALQSRADGMTAQFRDGAAGSFLGLRWGINSREGAVGASVTPPAFLFATTAGTALRAELSGSGTIDLEVSYWDDDVA